MSWSSAVVDGQPATWEQYLALPEDPRVEFIDGQLRVRPQASRRHQEVALALTTGVAAALPPGHDVTLAWAWKAGDDEFIPDVMVHPVTDEDARFTGVPALVAEVLSEEAGEDLALHLVKYAAAGLPHLWVVNAAARTIDVFRLAPGGYRLVTHLAAAACREPVDLAFGVATAKLNLPALL